MLTDLRNENLQSGLDMTNNIQRISTELQSVEQCLLRLDHNETLSDLQKNFAKFATNVHNLSRDHQVLKSLMFNSMTVRHANIIDAHAKTFDWIFRSHVLPETDIRSTIGFSDWLRNGEGAYWITGKPGM